MKTSSTAVVPQDHILRSIVVIRDHRVILDADIARLYAVQTRVLVQAVKRNLARFPADFMFAVTPRELRILRSQNVISSSWGGRRTAPYAFTENGVAMLSTVLRSKRAIAVNIQIMRAFVRLREVVASHAALLRKMDALEQKYDGQFGIVFDAIRRLMDPVRRRRRQIGFATAKKK